jgi:hypothetical protein
LHGVHQHFGQQRGAGCVHPGDDVIETLTICGREDDVADGAVGYGDAFGAPAWRARLVAMVLECVHQNLGHKALLLTGLEREPLLAWNRDLTLIRTVVSRFGFEAS